MVSYLYKPNCPLANEKGFVIKDDYWAHKYYTEPDLRMMIGNKPVSINYIPDEMAPTRHMCNGKRYTSKHKFRQVTKDYGCVEVGNETKIKPKKYIPPTSKRQRREDIRKAINDWKTDSINPQEKHEITETAKQINYHNRHRRRKN